MDKIPNAKSKIKIESANLRLKIANSRSLWRLKSIFIYYSNLCIAFFMTATKPICGFMMAE
jgi:hypothetical protein